MASESTINHTRHLCDDMPSTKHLSIVTNRYPNSIVTHELDIAPPNKRTLVVRPLSPDDLIREQLFFNAMTPDERYRRFFAPKQQLSEIDLVRFTHIDYGQNDFAIGAVNLDTDRFVAIGRYIHVDPEKRTVELAIVVLSEFQGIGLATHLVKLLFRIAQQHGTKTIVADFLQRNKAAIKLFDNAVAHVKGTATCVGFEDGVASYEYSLPPMSAS